MVVSRVELTSRAPEEYSVKLFSHLVEVEMRSVAPSVVATLLGGKVRVTVESSEE